MSTPTSDPEDVSAPLTRHEKEEQEAKARRMQVWDARAAARGVYTYELAVPTHGAVWDAVENLIHEARMGLGDPGLCDCKDGSCGDCRMRSAIRRLRRVTEPVHRSLHPERLDSCYAERIFFEKWVALNKRDSAINNGETILEIILTPYRQRDKRGISWHGFRGDYTPPVSQRDAEVAASFAQWLGTNMGRSFVRAAEAEAKQGRDNRSEWEKTCRELGVKDPDDIEARPRDPNDDHAYCIASKHHQPGTKQFEALLKDLRILVQLTRKHGLPPKEEPKDDKPKPATAELGEDRTRRRDPGW